MAIPFHTHIIDVLDQDASVVDDEPYFGDTAASRTVTAAGVRAIISAPHSGAEITAGGEQSTVYQKFKCDEVPIDHRSWVRDTATGDVFKVVYVGHRNILGMRYVQGQLKRVEGLP